MTEAGGQSTVQAIRAALQSMEGKLRGGGFSPDGLGDLKSALDDARLRLWAAMSASGAADPEGVLLRFRLRRATEICRAVAADLEAGTLGAHQRELMELRNATEHLADRLSASIRGGG